MGKMIGGLFGLGMKPPKDPSLEELRRQRADQEAKDLEAERLRRAKADGATSLLNPTTGFLGVPFTTGPSSGSGGNT